MYSDRMNYSRKCIFCTVCFLSSFLAPNTMKSPILMAIFSSESTPHYYYLVFYQKLHQIFLKRWWIKPLIHRNPLSSLNEKSSTWLYLALEGYSYWLKILPPHFKKWSSKKKFHFIQISVTFLFQVPAFSFSLQSKIALK